MEKYNLVGYSQHSRHRSIGSLVCGAISTPFLPPLSSTDGCCLREWVENQRESDCPSVRTVSAGLIGERGGEAQFMEECYGYERNKMAMVIGVMDEDLQRCVRVSSVHCPVAALCLFGLPD